MDLSVWDYHNYIGKINTYRPNGCKYPYQWTQEKTEKNKINGEAIKGSLGKSEQTELTTETLSVASSSIEVQETFWSRDLSSMKTTFQTADTRDSSKANSMYYELLCEDVENPFYSYWLASRFVYNTSDSAVFGLFNVSFNGVSNGYTLYSTGHSFSKSYCVCPVVSIPSNVIDLSINYETVGKWNLKNS